MAADDLLDILIRVRGGKQAARELRNVGDEAEEMGHKVEHAGRRFRRSGKGMLSMLNSVSGRLKILVPLALGAAPALTALASSAGAAAGGMGLLGGAAIASAIVGVGGLALVTAGAVGGLKEVFTAQKAYTLAVAQHGATSTQAESAQKKLNAQIKIAGGPPIARLIGQLDRLTKGWATLTSSARGDVFAVITDGLRGANRLMPTFAEQTNLTARSLRADLVPAMRALSGREMQRNIVVFSETFRGMASGVIRGAVDLFIALLRYVRAAAPYVVQAAEGFAGWARSFRQTSTDSGLVADRVRMLVGHTRAWLRLLGALAGLVLAVFGVSHEAGQGLVVTMTAGVEQLTAWVNAARDAGSAQGAFAGWVKLFVGVGENIVTMVGYIGELAHGALPALESAAGGTQVVLKALGVVVDVLVVGLRLLAPLIGPLIVAYAAWRAATIALTIATVALNVAFRLTPLGWLVTGLTALAAAFVVLYSKVGWFRRAVQGVWNWIKANWPKLLMMLTGPIGLAVIAIVRNWETIKVGARAVWSMIRSGFNSLIGFFRGLPARTASAFAGLWTGLSDGFKAAINWIIGKWNSLSFGMDAVKVAGETIIPAVRVSTPDIPLLGAGGTIMERGAAIVGDEGPEVVNLPRGAQVAPLSSGSGPVREVVRLITVDGRVLAEAVFNSAESAAARA